MLFGLSAVAVIAILYLLTWTIYTRTIHPLSKVPGPFLASVSRIWIIKNTLGGNIDQVEKALHQKYGPIVRVAPDEIVCADPAAIKKVYGYHDPLTKTDFYTPWGSARTVFSKRIDLFAELDNHKHAQRRRIVNHVYTLSNILLFEPFLDECSELFILRMGQLADTGQVVDLGEWFQWYAFDVIGQLFFGNMFGFMTNSEDHESWIAALDKLLPYIIAMSVTPATWRPLIGLSAIFSKAARQGLDAMNLIVEATTTSVDQRLATSRSPDKSGYRNDLLQQMLEIVQVKGEKVDFGVGDIKVESHVAIFAGSDTTATVMRGVMYYLMKHPEIYQQVESEVDEASKDGRISFPVKYAESLKLPLLCATIKEAMRLYPSVGMSMPRWSPPGGIELANTYIPEGYRIGVNAAVVGFDRSIFGSDAEEFRPARWLEGDAAFMEKYILVFGAGTRTCIGRHIALTEVHKLLPHFIREFHVELVDPNMVWTTIDMFISKQTGIMVNIKRRT